MERVRERNPWDEEVFVSRPGGAGDSAAPPGRNIIDAPCVHGFRGRGGRFTRGYSQTPLRGSKVMSDSGEEIESFLRRYRPVGPRGELRGRALAATPVIVHESRPLRLWRYAASAMVVLSAGLMIESARLAHLSSRHAASQPTRSFDPERALAILGADEATRKYFELAMSLEAQNQPLPPFGLNVPAGDAARLLERYSP